MGCTKSSELLPTLKYNSKKAKKSRMKQSQKAARWCEKALIFASYVNERMEQQVSALVVKCLVTHNLSGLLMLLTVTNVSLN